MNTSLKALSKEVADLKAWINNAHDDIQGSAAINKDAVAGGLKGTRKDLRSLRRYIGQADAFLRLKFPTSESTSSTSDRPSTIIDVSSTTTGSGVPPGICNGPC